MNKAILVGNVGQDPEVRTLQSGDPVANFSLATSERWKDKKTGEKKEKTEWHRCVAFGPLAKVIGDWVGKGSKLAIEGQIKTRKWQDQSGQDKYSTEIHVKEMEMLSSKPEKADGDQALPKVTGQTDLDDEIPF